MFAMWLPGQRELHNCAVQLRSAQLNCTPQRSHTSHKHSHKSHKRTHTIHKRSHTSPKHSHKSHEPQAKPHEPQAQPQEPQAKPHEPQQKVNGRTRTQQKVNAHGPPKNDNFSRPRLKKSVTLSNCRLPDGVRRFGAAPGRQ